ncbi:MAG: hypothetical protein D6769_03095 [Methanobacteriota archaeon]|nr:MAG: hypothetical protein D6769_03095 [Euryarchaeota archaeon]
MRKSRMPSPMRLWELSKRTRAIDLKDKSDIERVRRAYKEICEKKNRDPEDMGPGIEHLLAGTAEGLEKWLSVTMTVHAVIDDYGEIAAGTRFFGLSGRKPYTTAYVPYRLEELKKRAEEGSLPDYVPVKTVQHYDLENFNLKKEVFGKESGFFEYMFILLLESYKNAREFRKNSIGPLQTSNVSGIDIISSKDDKTMAYAVKCLILELAGLETILDKKEVTPHDVNEAAELITETYERYFGKERAEQEEKASAKLCEVANKGVPKKLIEKYRQLLGLQKFPNVELSERFLRVDYVGTTLLLLSPMVIFNLDKGNFISNIGRLLRL